MSIVTLTTYGLGGYDPDAPNGNVVEVREVEVQDTPPSVVEVLDALPTHATVADVIAALRQAFA
jgi:hypothetical protein